MATYEEIYGKRVEVLDTDPTLNSSYEGQVWYNSTSGVLKSVVSFASWSAGPDVNQVRVNGSASGIQTAAVFGGGNAPPYSTDTEEYDGTGFSVGGAMNDNRDPYSGFGTLTDTVTAGGYDGSNKDVSETYNGTSWSEGPDLNTARRGQQGFGTSGDAGVCCGGYTTSASTATEEYNGSSWTTVTSMPTARYSGCAVGAQTSGIQVAGDPGSVTTSFEYDGTNWSSGGALATGRSFIMLGGANQDAVIAFGGETSPGPISTSSENYDGTSWTTGTAMGTAHKNISCGGWGTKTATFAAFGNGPPGGTISSTEEYNISINTITPAAWSSGGNLNTARSQGTGAGTMTAGWIVCGSEPSLSNKTEEYDGSSWTAANNIGMSSRLVAGAGPQTSAFATGGFTGPSTVVTSVYNYDGTDWTAGAAQPVGTYGQGSFGTQTAGVICGGSAPSTSNYLTTSYEYDGEGWTASPGSMNNGRHYIAGSGIQTAGLIAGGHDGGVTNYVEEYNGSTWSNGATSPDSRRGGGLSGPQTAALYFGGSGDPGNRTDTAAYDGTSWSTRPSIATSRRLIAGGSKNGTTTSAWMAGGQLESPDARSALTEEFTGDTETVTASTLTTS